MRKLFIIVSFFTVTLCFYSHLPSQVQRFPKPEFESGHIVPSPTFPHPRQNVFEYVDAAVLLITLTLVSYIALKKRSRNGIFILMIFSLIYFGYFRKGCVCAIGSIQNMTLAVFDPLYTIPLTVIIFFTLPLLFTLFFGRTFCAAVCPLGAIQDIVVIKPVKISVVLQKVLGTIPYFYLGLAILLAATGAEFIVCRYDPFIGFFRFGANLSMIAFGAGFLILGVFIARPYCRFLCPYGLLLNWMSRLSKWHVTITPDECIQCRLCEGSCPFSAILIPTPPKPLNSRKVEIKRLAVLILIIPLLIFGGSYLGFRLQIPLSRIHKTVRLAERIRLEELDKVEETTLESRTFEEMGKPIEQLYSEAESIRTQFRNGGPIYGGFIGLAFSGMLIGLSIRRKREDYIPNRGTCLSCGRCFSHCPIEKDRLKKLKESTTQNESQPNK